MGFPARANGLPTMSPKRPVMAISIAALFCNFAAPLYADVTEDLLDKLKNKGVLTDDEYQEMQTQVQDERRQKSQLKARDADANTLIGKFRDGFVFESADGQHAISPTGRIQGDYRMFRENASPNTFDVRRAYLGAKGKLYDDITFNVTGDFAQSSGNVGQGGSAVQLDEGYVNLGWIKWAQFRIGQFQMPYSLEKITSDLFNNFQERWIGDIMSPDKLRGAMVHGSPTAGVYYGLALTNGNGNKNVNDTDPLVDGKEVVGRVAVNLAEIFGQKQAIYHFGTSYASTRLSTANGSATFTGRTEARGLSFFKTDNFTGTNPERRENGFETALAYGPVKFQAESSVSNFKGTSAAGVGYDRDIKGYYASLVWLITGESYADTYSGGVFTRIRPNSNFTGSGGTGAWEIGARYTRWDATDFTSTNPVGGGVLSAGTTNKANATTLGLKWIVNPNTRFLANYVDTRFGGPVTVPVSLAAVNHEKAFTMRAQLDF